MRKENKFLYLEVILDSTQQCFCFEELCGIYWLVTKMATQKESTTTSIWWRHFLSYKVTQNNKNISRDNNFTNRKHNYLYHYLIYINHFYYELSLCGFTWSLWSSPFSIFYGQISCLIWNFDPKSHMDGHLCIVRP